MRMNDSQMSFSSNGSIQVPKIVISQCPHTSNLLTNQKTIKALKSKASNTSSIGENCKLDSLFYVDIMEKVETKNKSEIHPIFKNGLLANEVFCQDKTDHLKTIKKVKLKKIFSHETPKEQTNSFFTLKKETTIKKSRPNLETKGSCLQFQNRPEKKEKSNILLEEKYSK